MNSDAIRVPTHNVRARTALHAGVREDNPSPSAAILALIMALEFSGCSMRLDRKPSDRRYPDQRGVSLYRTSR
jgi:hypothetical protein